MRSYLPRGKGTKNIVLVFIFFILIVVIVPQNAVAEEIRRVNASEILENITRGEPVEVTNSIIIGELNVNKIKPNLSNITIDGKNRSIVNNSISILTSYNMS